MKRNIFHRSLCFMLMFLFLMSTASASNSIQPRYTQVRSFRVNLSISDSGCAQCVGQVELRDSSYEIDLAVELQRNNGWSWSTIKSWSASGTGVVSLDKEWYVSSGYTYRVYASAEVTAPDGTVVETVPTYSLASKY